MHRDIKPDNFAIGLHKNDNTIYILDYGLAKAYRDSLTGEHIPFNDDRRLTGTVRYSSLNTLLGYEQSRRDDLEGLAYTLIYLLKGKLPWQRIKASCKRDKYDKILHCKSEITIDKLCQGLPDEINIYMNYCRSLAFEDKPDYANLKKMFNDYLINNNFEKDFKFDWFLTKEQRYNKFHIETPNTVKAAQNIEEIKGKNPFSVLMIDFMGWQSVGTDTNAADNDPHEDNAPPWSFLLYKAV